MHDATIRFIVKTWIYVPFFKALINRSVEMLIGYVKWHVLMTIRNECYRAMSVVCALWLWAKVDYTELRDM